MQEALRAAGVDIPFYHSRLGTPWERQELVKRFLGQSLPVVDHIICTNAFGMGLDVPNVRLVIHWQQSASTEDMLQEFGRAGRDGKPSLSVIFHDGRAGKDAVSPEVHGGKDSGRLRAGRRGTRQNAWSPYSQIDQVSTMLRSQQCFRRPGQRIFR